jgi:hypothetical protein
MILYGTQFCPMCGESFETSLKLHLRSKSVDLCSHCSIRNEERIFSEYSEVSDDIGALSEEDAEIEQSIRSEIQ